MLIDFKSGIDRGKATKVIEDMASLLEIPEEAIERVIVADRYGEAIAEVLAQPGARTHTENSQMRGVGKTIPKRGTDGSVRNTIVLPTSTLEAAFNYLDPAFSGDRPVAGLLHYVVGHEMGHAKDNAARRTADTATLDIGGPFRVAAHERYWARLLLDEFFACVHSGEAVPPDVFREMVSQKQEGIAGFLDHVFGCLGRFWTKETDARNVKLNVAVTYWRGLVDQATLFGTAIGRGECLETVPSVWPDLNEKSQALDTKLASALLEFWQAYPAVDVDAAQETLGALWREAIQVERSYRFAASAREDSLYVADTLIDDSSRD